MEWVEAVKAGISMLAGGSPEAIVLLLLAIIAGMGFVIIKVTRAVVAYHKETVVRYNEALDKKDQALAKHSTDLVEVITETNGTLSGLQQAFQRIEYAIMSQLGRK